MFILTTNLKQDLLNYECNYLSDGKLFINSVEKLIMKVSSTLIFAKSHSPRLITKCLNILIDSNYLLNFWFFRKDR
jgi:hypothetical protein